MGPQADEGTTQSTMDDGLNRQLFEARAEALVVVDGQGRIALLNLRAEALFGYRSAELTGQPVEVLLAVSDREGHSAHRAGFARAPRAGPMGAGRPLRARRKDGSLFAVEVSLLPLPGPPEGQVVAQVAHLGEAVRLGGQVGVMLGAAPVAVCVLDGDGTFARVNDTYGALLGYRPHELIGLPVIALYPPETREEGQAAFRRALAGGAPDVGERTLCRKDGTPVAVQATAIPVVGPDGRPQLAIVAVDIGERKRAEEAIGRLIALVDNSSDAIIGLAVDRTITNWNAGAERLYGYSAAEAVGRSIDLLVVPGGPDEAALIGAALRRGESVVDLDTVRRRKDGSVVPVSLSVSHVRDGSGAIIGAVGIHRDIGARKAAEEALVRANAELARANTELARANAEWETLLRVLPIGVGIANDPAITSIRMNPALARMLALPPEANASLTAPEGERPTNWRAFQGNRQLAPDELPFSKAAATGEDVSDMELEVVREDGVRLTQLAYAAPLRDEQGRVRGAVGAFLDISARVLAERQRDLLLASMAHDLKGPLSALVWLAEVLQRRAAGPDHAHILDSFVQGARQLMGQINEIVDTTSAQLGRPPELELRRGDLAALVGRLAAEQAQLGRGISLRVEGAERPLPGLYDEGRLARALANVLGNATKYSAPGGEVFVALSRAEEATGTWATVRVADRGIGIPAAELGQVFEPFYRASNARRQAEGSGLGLAGVRQIVAAHGGSVRLESEEGVGTTVTIHLPLWPPELAGTTEEAREAPSQY